MFIETPHDPLTRQIIGAAIDVHRALGPGLLESAYERCLEHELDLRHLQVERQVALPVVYKDLVVEKAYFVDLLVEGKVVVELKAVEELTDAHRAQVLTHLKWANLRVGLLINFNEASLRRGLRRLVRG